MNVSKKDTNANRKPVSEESNSLSTVCGLEALSPQIEDDVDILLNVMRGRNQGNPIVEQLINTRESQRLTDPPV